MVTLLRKSQVQVARWTPTQAGGNGRMERPSASAGKIQSITHLWQAVGLFCWSAAKGVLTLLLAALLVLSFMLTWVVGLSIRSARAAERVAPSIVTPFHGQARNYECRTLVLDQGNAVGFLSMPHDAQTVRARILFRAGGAQQSVELRMMRAEAEALRSEVDALVRKLRSKPIRFQSTLSRGGECQIAEVSG